LRCNKGQQAKCKKKTTPTSIS